MEFEWKIFPGFNAAAILNEIQKMMGELQCDPADFKDRIIFVSMFNDIVWDARGNEELSENNVKKFWRTRSTVSSRSLAFLGPESEKKYGIPSGHWTQTAEKLLLNFEKSGHPIFRCTSALEIGKLRSKERGKTTIHFTACTVANENGHVRQSGQSLWCLSGYDSGISLKIK